MSLLEQVLTWRLPHLGFEPEQERRFVRARAEARLMHFAASGVVALIVYNIYLLSDKTLVPDVFEKAMQLRLYWLTPFGLALLIIALGFKKWTLSLPSGLLEGAVMMTGIVAALLMGVILLETHSPFGIIYRAGLVPVLIYGNLVQRFRFRYALTFSVSVLLVCLASMVQTFLHPPPFAVLDVPLGLLVMVIAAYTLIMNFRMELEERRRFLRTERAAELRLEIDGSKRALDALSRQDSLTGAPNRRHFDEVMQQHWREHLHDRDKLALLMIDVDHFKAYNDRYGHPSGDQCLRHVALALQNHIPASLGCMARWGGEEFIVLLPHADVDQAMQRAQALVRAVAALSLRHQASPTAAHVTISIGVAVAMPGHGVASPDELIARADKALYGAKDAGRNRCVAA